MENTTALQERRVDEQLGYSDEQRAYLENLYGLKINPEQVLVSRGMGEPIVPSGRRSCSVLAPGQELPYYENGIIYTIDAKKIPWVSPEDAGTPQDYPEGFKPAEAVTLSKYLQERYVGSSSVAVYSETVIDLTDEHPIAMYDFSQLFLPPNVMQRLFTPSRAAIRQQMREEASFSQRTWRQKAQEYGLRLITQINNQALMEKIHQRELERKIKMWGM